jgi:hypothetical protein
VTLLAFWYVPNSITVHGGFGSGSEVSPRFTPYLIAALMTAAMVGRLVQLGLAAARGALREIADDLHGTGTKTETQRGALLNGMALAYGFILIPLAGFYVASVLLVGALVRMLGDSRPIVVAGAGLGVALFAYLLFEEALGVRLPKGALGNWLRTLGG